MKIELTSKTKKAVLNTEGPFVVIGEKINPTGRKKLAAALLEGNMDYVRELAGRQIAAGADVLDVNVGVPGADDVVLMQQVVRLLAAEFDVPLCLDSPNPAALEAALPLCAGKALVNSVNGEERSLRSVLPLVKEHGAAVIGLTMDEHGIPGDAETRLSIAERIFEHAARLGIAADDVVIDPLVLTVGADQRAAAVTLQTIELVRREFGVNINIGASNISFGLPDRDTINSTFLSMAIYAGATCAITDPMKYSLLIRAADLLRGKDSNAMRYLKYYRAHMSEKVAV